MIRPRHWQHAALLLLLAAPARADLLLNEVLYDAAGPDEGAEWVELWNPDARPWSLAGVALEAADGGRPEAWAAVFRGSAADTVPAGGAFLVSGAALTDVLQNGPDALRLVRDGAVLDLLGYGALEEQSLFEGAPAPDAASGHSLSRREDGGDTGRNADDWEEEAAPTPGRANRPLERITLVRGSVALEPVVPWPGEAARVRARVANRGRLPLAASRWRLLVESLGAEESGGSGPAAGAALGVGLAPGESAWVEVGTQAAAPGPFRIRVRTAAADGVPETAALADTARLAGRTLASPAIVNEVAFRDAAGSPGAGEWIELWFREPVTDVGLLGLADGSSPPRPIARGEEPRPVPAGALLVVAQNPGALRERTGLDSSLVLGLAGSWPTLNDTNGPSGFADLVRVVAADSVPCDVIAYDARAVARGGTLERLSPDLPGHLAGTFAECVDPSRATPGRANSLRAPDQGLAPPGALLLASARVLRREDGQPPLLIRLAPEARGRLLVVRVHDLLGRRVRTLVDGQRFASEGAFAWDGRDEGGAWVRPGLYVVAAEAAAEEGRGPRRTAIPVAVSARGADR